MAFDFHPFLCKSDEKAMINDRLDGMEADAVYEICRDKSEPLNTRFFGAFRLPPAYQTRLIDCIVLDCNDVLWTQLHKLFPPSDTPELRATLHRYFDECDDEFRVAPLHILAKFGDESVLRIAENLLASTTRGDRVLAVACLRILGTESAYKALRHYWPNEKYPLDTRVQAAGDLLRHGELEPLSFLIEIADQNQTKSAYYSLIAIFHHYDRELGFKLMHGILSCESHGAQKITLSHVANLMSDLSLRDHPDGVDLARDWVAMQYVTR